MSDPFIAEIILFGGNFAPRGWAFCDGQLLSISSNTALFSLLGTTYGGDGRTTFALPDLRGRVPLGPRNGPGLSNYTLGQRGGTQSNTLTTNQMPSHNHTVNPKATAGEGETGDPANAFPSLTTEDVYHSAPDTTEMGQSTTSSTGGSTSVENRQPFLALNYIIALIGVFPSRN